MLGKNILQALEKFDKEIEKTRAIVSAFKADNDRLREEMAKTKRFGEV